jgi:hypothetical protein
MWAANIKSSVNDNNNAHNFFYKCSSNVHFTVVKLGMVTEGQSKGQLVGKICQDGWKLDACGILNQYPGVRFCDVGAFLISLACAGDAGAFERKYVLMEYSK